MQSLIAVGYGIFCVFGVIGGSVPVAFEYSLCNDGIPVLTEIHSAVRVDISRNCEKTVIDDDTVFILARAACRLLYF